jgi:hypothetical protein
MGCNFSSQKKIKCHKSPQLNNQNKYELQDKYEPQDKYESQDKYEPQQMNKIDRRLNNQKYIIFESHQTIFIGSYTKNVSLDHILDVLSYKNYKMTGKLINKKDISLIICTNEDICKIYPDYNINDIMEKLTLSKKYTHNCNIPINLQKNILKIQLNIINTHISQYCQTDINSNNYKDNNELLIECNPLFIIFIKNMDKKKSYLHVRQNDTIWSLKKQIERCTNINIDDQYLLYNDKILNNEFTMKNYNISHKTVLILKLREDIIINISNGAINLYNIENENINFNFDDDVY